MDEISNKDRKASSRTVTWYVNDARIAFNHPETGELIIIPVAGLGKVKINSYSCYSFEVMSNGVPLDSSLWQTLNQAREQLT
jgi:hypothetical protein